MAFQSQIRSVDDLVGPAGRLEALLNTGVDDPPFSALVTHPHPPSGGTMHTKAVYHAMKAFSSFGIPVLRFNFRGTGRSEGVHDEGKGEVDDTRAALGWLSGTFAKPILFAGFSFGANVGLRACCGDPRVAGLIGLGVPVRAAGRDYTYNFLPSCTQPKLFLLGDHDEFAPRHVMEGIFASAAEPKELRWVANADHFFQGVPADRTSKLDRMNEEMRDWLATHFAVETPQ